MRRVAPTMKLRSHIDFVPTLLELAGATTLPTRELDGVSLVPVLNGSSASLRDDSLLRDRLCTRCAHQGLEIYCRALHPPSVYAQIDSGYLWKNHKTGLFTEPRPYYVNNSSLGSLAQGTHPGYYDDDQLYDLHCRSGRADQPLWTGSRGCLRSQETIGRLYRRYTGPPVPPVQRRFEGIFSRTVRRAGCAGQSADAVPGTEHRSARLERCIQQRAGLLVEQSTNGASFEIISELPSGSNSTTVAVDAGMEDIVLRVSSYNALGDSAAASDVDLLAPDNWRYRTFGSTTSSNSQWECGCGRRRACHHLGICLCHRSAGLKLNRPNQRGTDAGWKQYLAADCRATPGAP